MLPVLLHIGLVAAVATLLAVWCGWWMSRLLLPTTLRLWAGLLAPLMGYALLLLIGYWCVRDWVGLPAVLFVLLPLAGALNLIAWRRTGPPRLAGRVQRHIPLALLVLITFAVGVTPLVSYGYPGIIGANWDIENYLPVARYLEQGPVSDIAAAPPNPLRDLNASPPRIGLTLGFSILHGSVDLLTGQEAITTFAIVLAWLRALGVAGVYVLLRTTLGLRREYALLGGAMVSAGSLLLWVEYFNFGMQMAAWPLLPLGLVVGIGAVSDFAVQGRRAWPAAAGAAVALSALPVAYYPALTLFVPLAAGLGLAVLWRPQTSREEVLTPTSLVDYEDVTGAIPSRLRLLVGAGVLLAAVAILSMPAIYDYMQGFSFRYGQQLTSLGLFSFVPLTDFAGLTTFDLRRESPVSWSAWAGLVALLGLMVTGLTWGSRRARWLGLAAGVVGYLVWLRLEDYPYAWMKGGSYAAFPLLGLAPAGVQALMDRPFHKALRYVGAAAGLTLLVMMASAQGRTVADHMTEPGLYADELPNLLALRSLIADGSKVNLTPDARIHGVAAALPAYLLDHTTVLGSTATGYVPHWSNGASGELGDFGLLLSEEYPDDRGFSYDDKIWSGGGYALFENDYRALFQADINETVPPGRSFFWSTGGRFPGGPSLDPGHTGLFEVISFGQSTIRVDEETVPFGPGVTHVRTIVNDDGASTIFANTGQSPVTVRWARIFASTGTTASVEQLDTGAIARANAAAGASTVTTTLELASPGAGPVTAALDIWDHERGAHYGWYGMEQGKSGEARRLTLTLDLVSGEMVGLDAAGAPVALGGGLDRIGEGYYTARLNLLAGSTMLASPQDLFSFGIDSRGEVTSVEAHGETLVAVALDRPPVPLDVTVGEDIQLMGYALGSSKAMPGDRVPLTLWWRAKVDVDDERSVLIHLRGSTGEKLAQADGPPANGGRPTSQWEEGEVIIDQHTLNLPADLPEGEYHIAVGMYRYPSLNILPMLRGSERPAGDVVLIPLRVRR